MSANTFNPFSPFIGQRTAPRIISRSHGIVRPNLMEDLNITPKLEIKAIGEFDNLVDGLIYQVFGGATGKLSFMESNMPLAMAAMMDVDPTVQGFAANPTLLTPFDLFGNFKGLDGNVKASFLLYGCQLSEASFTQPQKDGAKRSLSFTALNSIIFYGLGLLYSRIRGSGAIQAVPAAPTVATATTGGFLAPGNYFVMVTATTANGETTPCLETPINIPTGTSTNDITVTCPNVSSPITGYNVYVGNYSNGERFVGAATASSSNTLVITSLPSSQSGTPPVQNTSGIWAGATDQVFSSNAATLVKTAVAPQGSGLQYALVKQNGIIVGTPDNPATNSDFVISADGTTFTSLGTSTYQCFDVLTPYAP